MSRVARLSVATALALPLLGALPAHADHCEGNAPQAVLTACTTVYGTYCDVSHKPCPVIRFE
jgi:hypothetical protein